MLRAALTYDPRLGLRGLPSRELRIDSGSPRVAGRHRVDYAPASRGGNVIHARGTVRKQQAVAGLRCGGNRLDRHLLKHAWKVVAFSAVNTRLKNEMIHRQERRHELMLQENCRFVEPREFLDYATSRHHLIRSNELEAGIHGLLDPETGIRLLIEEEKLFSLRTVGR